MKCRANWHAIVGAVGLTVVGGLLSGCGSKYGATVTGAITFDGKALPRGTVKFAPDGGGGPTAYGLIADDGTYTIVTGREKGLPAGPYIVTVVANEPSVPGPNPSLPPAAGKPITPPWLRDQAKSPLKYTVQPGKNEINMDLTSTPPPGYKTVKQR